MDTFYPASVDYVVYVIPSETSWLSEAASGLSALAALASVVIAVTAVWISRRQLKMHEQHNKKMATPHISSWIAISTDDKTLEYSIQNNGLGPAIVKNIALSVDGKPVTNKKGYQLSEAALDLLLDGVGSTREYEMPDLGMYIPTGKKYRILACKFQHHDPEEILGRIKRRAHLAITYESIYGETYTFCSKSD